MNGRTRTKMDDHVTDITQSNKSQETVESRNYNPPHPERKERIKEEEYAQTKTCSLVFFRLDYGD